jgi:hypothetical protein
MAVTIGGKEVYLSPTARNAIAREHAKKVSIWAARLAEDAETFIETLDSEEAGNSSRELQRDAERLCSSGGNLVEPLTVVADLFYKSIPGLEKA